MFFLGVMVFIFGIIGYGDKFGTFLLWTGFILIILGLAVPSQGPGEYIPGTDCGYDQAGFQQGSDC